MTNRIKKKFVILIYSLLSFGLASACSKTSYLKIVGSSATALIDGSWASACVNFDLNQDTFTDGAKIFYKIENGKAYSAFLFYDQDTACAGSYTMRRTLDGSLITEPDLDTVNMQFLSVSDAPAQFYILSGEDVQNNNQISFNILYKEDVNNFFLLAEAVDTNKGSLWADWIAASADATSFAASPTTFSPGTGGGAGGVDSFLVHLTRLP